MQRDRRRRVLFATAELRPVVSVGGLGEAAGGLVAALPDAGVDVLPVLPGYDAWPLEAEQRHVLQVPAWAGPVSARVGVHAEVGPLAIIDADGLARPHAYVDDTGEGWADNTERFARFSVGVAALTRTLAPGFDVVHLNDWHTSMVVPFLGSTTPTVLTIHNLAHQGWAGPDWLHRLPAHRDRYRWGDSVNLLAGAIRSVDRVVAVSPRYAEEIRTEAAGAGLDGVFAEPGVELTGILNGIDTRVWDPAHDAYAPQFSAASLGGKAAARAALLDHVGWGDTGEPLVVAVTRLVDQKGLDLAFGAARFLEGMKARMIVLGSGERPLADWARWLAATHPGRFWFHDGYDAALSHLLFAGGDLLMMPSRFEPCGLAQMQAMAYGTIPVVTPVGGLIDTVVDADDDRAGNGFVAEAVDEAAVVDALHRALRSWRHAGRRKAIQTRGMTRDWSWRDPALAFAGLYAEIAP